MTKEAPGSGLQAPGEKLAATASTATPTPTPTATPASTATPTPASTPTSTSTPTPWLSRLRRFTPARIGLGRAGPALPTREVLAFGLAHARARDAVQADLDVPRLLADLAAAGIAPAPAVVRSAAPDRTTYLLRPDLGRRLAEGEAARLAGPAEVAIVIADGLSALAVQRHAAPLVAALRARAPERWGRAAVVIGLRGRVALGDEIGAALGARLAAVLVGERPGLGSPDSLGVYLTHGPRPGRTDAERNCVSNVRPAGLTCDEAARRVDWLAAAALSLRLTGVGLKDESDLPPLPPQDGGIGPG